MSVSVSRRNYLVSMVLAFFMLLSFYIYSVNSVLGMCVLSALAVAFFVVGVWRFKELRDKPLRAWLGEIFPIVMAYNIVFIIAFLYISLPSFWQSMMSDIIYAVAVYLTAIILYAIIKNKFK